MIFGVGFVVANQFLAFTTPTIAGSIAMIASIIIVPVVSLITPKPAENEVDKIFACYEEKVLAPAKEVLEEE